MRTNTDTVTAEHMVFWDEALQNPQAVRGQTAEQAQAMTIGSFQYACQLDGLPVPTEAAVRAKIAELRR